MANSKSPSAGKRTMDAFLNAIDDKPAKSPKKRSAKPATKSKKKTKPVKKTIIAKRG